MMHSKSVTHLKLRKQPDLFRSLKVCDFPCLDCILLKDAVVQCASCLGFPSKAQTGCTDPCPRLLSFVLNCLAFLHSWGGKKPFCAFRVPHYSQGSSLQSDGSLSGPLRLRVQSWSRTRLRIAASIAFLFRACFKGV